jgi:protein-L-isoaspartate(D-aspartate) O-methyltransferase
MQSLSKLIVAGVLLSSAFAFAADEARQTTVGDAAARGTTDWTYEKFKKAFAESGRKINVSEKSFNEIQERKAAALKEIEIYLKERLGKIDPVVMRAFGEIPREYFHYHYADKYPFVTLAYEEKAKPWAIGYGSALSDYLGQAYMTQLAKPTSESVVLEIGTGSGFQISLLSRIVKKAYSIEIIEPLGNGVAKIFKPLHYDNVQTRVGDGYFGWPEVREGFDIIMVTCAAQFVPPALFKQLKPGGRLVIPIGQPFKKGQVLYVYTKDQEGKIHSRKDVGVYFIPMTGAMEKEGV